jgi:hypothetical protein
MSGGWTSTLTRWIFGKFLLPLLSPIYALGYNGNRADQSMDVYVATWLIEAELVLHVGQLLLVLLTLGLLYTGFFLDDLFLVFERDPYRCILLLNCI